METQSFTMLPEDEIRIVKQIFLAKESQNNDTLLDYILYEREISSTYKYEKTINEEGSFSDEFPQQNEFPNDNIDNLIMACIKSVYDKSFVENHFVICNLDKEKIKILQNIQTEESLIRIIPNSLIGDNLYRLEKEVNIYVNSTQVKLKNIAFNGYYDINNLSILDEVNEIKFI